MIQWKRNQTFIVEKKLHANLLTIWSFWKLLLTYLECFREIFIHFDPPMHVIFIGFYSNYE